MYPDGDPSTSIAICILRNLTFYTLEHDITIIYIVTIKFTWSLDVFIEDVIISHSKMEITLMSIDSIMLSTLMGCKQ